MKYFQKIINKVVAAVLAIFITITALLGIYNVIIPDSVSCMSGDSLPSFAGAVANTSSVASTASSGVSETTMVYTAEYRLWGVLPLKSVTVSVAESPSLYVGGMPFGVRFSTNGVMVVGYGSEQEKNLNPGYISGIKPSDVITSIDGVPISDVTALTGAVEQSGGRTMTFTCTRSGGEYTVSLTPYYSQSEEKYKSGLLVRDSGAGIGTVTYIVPETNSFGGLGHGICDGDTGSLIPLDRGTVTDVTINGVVRGLCGTPGELRGSFQSKKTGSLIKNTGCGVFGLMSDLPSNHGELLPTGRRSELKCGDAYILCTLDESGPQKYNIRISDIDTDASGSKCFTVKITDKNLLDKTGGIVQGMSGSPIIQNGKLVGAVTHVLINDPTIGYGIFIDNMLASMPDVLK